MSSLSRNTLFEASVALRLMVQDSWKRRRIAIFRERLRESLSALREVRQALKHTPMEQPKAVRAKRAAQGRHNPRARFPRIGEHAKTLGVSRGHLWLVLQGERSSPLLLNDYQTLIRNASPTT